jgi:hypothetical protein
LASAASRSDDQRDRRGARSDAEHTPSAAHVRVHCVKADALVPRDLLRRHAARDQQKDLGLTVGDPGEG